MRHIFQALVLVLLVHVNIVNANDLSEVQEEQAILDNMAQELLEQAMEAEINEQNVEQTIDIKKSEDEIRDGFLELLDFVEMYNDVDMVSEYLDRFFQEYNVSPHTRVKDFAGTRPYISLLRFVTHAARKDGQEGKFVLLKEMLKRGGNPFVAEAGERYSLIDENILTCNHLCHPDKTGTYEQMYNAETASEEVKSKVKSRMSNSCGNACRIHEVFKESDPEALY